MVILPKSHILRNYDKYISYVISTNVEKSHHFIFQMVILPKSHILRKFDKRISYVISSAVEKSHPYDFNSIRPLRFGRGDYILLIANQT